MNGHTSRNDNDAPQERQPVSLPDAKRGAHIPGHICPSCNRFIGPADVCPFCNADSARNPIYRRLRYVSICLAMASLAFLCLMNSHKEPRPVRISEITPMMDSAFVRVSGTVPRSAYVRRNFSGERVDYLSFCIEEGTDSLTVVAHGAVAAELHDSGLVPKRGTVVEVSGTLSVSAGGNAKLRVPAAKYVSVVPRPAVAPRAADDS